MIITSRIVLAVTVLFLVLQANSVAALTRVASSESDESSVTPLSWNFEKYEAPFTRQAKSASAGVAGPLVYPNGDFSFPLLQPLAFDSECDCYSLMLKRGTSGLELVNFWRARTGFYRSGN